MGQGTLQAGQPSDLLLSVFSTLMHQAVSVSFDFYQNDLARLLPQFREEGEDEIKMDYIFRARVKVMTAPLAQDFEKD